MAATVEAFPLEGLLPKEETGSTRFLAAHPEYDGRGVVVAVFDTGIDPAAAHLSRTSDGKPKIIDIVDATGSGDVDTATVRQAANGVLVGLSGRQLQIPSSWNNPSGDYHLGIKLVYELFPSGLVSRLKADRKKKWTEVQRDKVSSSRQKLVEWDKAHPSPSPLEKKEKEDLEAQLAVLLDLEKNYEDAGPVYDCVVFNDGTTWRAAVDISEKGDLASSVLLADYKVEQKYATFTDYDRMNYTVKIYENGNVLSIVTTAGSHGTHVAAIVAAFDADNSHYNGVAPGAQIVSIKIGDTRLGSMETGTGLVRGVIATLENKCDLINMSYGEASCFTDVGRFIQLVDEAVYKHNVIFVSSAGNNGPAMSTVGAPGGTTSSVIGVGAYVTQSMMATQYSLPDTPQDMQYTWSSRGPAFDGDLGVCISAPGGAITNVPTWTLKKGQLMNGTSMSSPNACGAISLIVSALKANSIPYTPNSVRRALENTAVNSSSMYTFDHGHGILQVDAAYDHIVKYSKEQVSQVRFAVSTRCRRVSGRGVYLRDEADFEEDVVDASVTVTPYMHVDQPRSDLVSLETNISIKATQPWVKVPAQLILMNEARSFTFQIQTANLPAGVSYAEIIGTQHEQRSLGAIFRVPITIVKPLQPSAKDGWKVTMSDVSLQAGHVNRYFVAVPQTATWIKVVLNTGVFDGSRRLVLHTQQNLPLASHKTMSKQSYPTMGGGESWEDHITVAGGKTVEICLAQWWSSVGDTKVTMIVEFHGLLTQPVHIHGSEGVARMEISCPLRPAQLHFKGQMKTWQQVLRPVAPGVIKPLNGARDLLPGNRRIHEVTLTYNFSQKDKCEVRPVVPVLSEFLYESDYEAQLWQLFDSNKKLIVTGDAFPHHYNYKSTLAKGDYVLKLQIRHDSVAQLEKVKTLPMILEKQLKDAINITVYNRAPAVGGSSIRELVMAEGSMSAVYVSGPGLDGLPTGCAAGDMITGTLKLVTLPEGSGSAGEVPVTYHVIGAAPSAPSSSSSSSSSSSAPTTLDEAKRDLQISWLAKLPAAEYDDQYQELVKAYPDHLPLRTAHLQNVKALPRTQANLLKTALAATNVVNLIDGAELARFFGVINDTNIPEVAEEKAKMDAKKTARINALHQKALALISLMELIETKGIEDEASLTAALAQIHPTVSQYGQDCKKYRIVPRPFDRSRSWKPYQSVESLTPPDTPAAAVSSEVSAALDSIFAILADTVRELGQWTDISSNSDMLNLNVKFQWRCNRPGLAVQALSKFLSNEPQNATKALIETRTNLFQHIGWYHCVWEETTLASFPDSFPLF